MRNYLLTFLLSFFYGTTILSQVVVNEISICNTNKELDPNYDYSGWIELYNNSETDIDIKNLYFSDDMEVPQKYKLGESRILPAKGYQVVWLNGELLNKISGYSLDVDAEDGGVIMITDQSGTKQELFSYAEQYPNISYGKLNDGDITSPNVYFIKSSFKSSNQGSSTANEVIAPPEFSLHGGFYENEITIEIKCPTENVDIYYTIDASEPTLESRKYEKPFTLSKTTVLRAKAFRNDLLEGVVTSATYLIKERQPNLPCIFLVMDTIDLYNDTVGIYCVGTNGIKLTDINPVANYNRDWTRCGNVEFLKSNELIFNHPVGLSISGNASRGYEQKSFKVKAKTKYGQKRLDYNFFSKRDGVRYKSLLLRNGGQFYTTIPLIHDACMQSLADVVPLDYQRATPVVVYLNGDYWGIYNIRERKNKDLLYSHYGYSETDIDIIEYNWSTTANNGSLTEWKQFETLVKNSDFTSDDDYKQIAQQMDIDNFLYYMSIELLIKNTDWPNNNQLIFKPHGDGKWRWVLQDLDKGLGYSSQNLLRDFIASSSTSLSKKLIVYLLNNEKFKEQYITTQCLVAGSVFESNRFKKQMLEIKSAIEPEYTYHKDRWCNQTTNDLEKTTNSILTYEVNSVNEAYENLKINFSLGNIYNLLISSDLDKLPITFNNQQIPLLPYNGKWFENKTLKLEAPLYWENKKFVCWVIKDIEEVENRVYDTTLNFLISKDIQITPLYERADYMHRDGLYLNEISAKNCVNVDNYMKYEDWVEIYNSSSESIDLKDYYLSNKKNKLDAFHFSETDPIETIVLPKSYKIIWCSKKNERGVLHTNFKLTNEGGSVYLSKLNSGIVELVDSINYVQHNGTNSFGRYPDGGDQLVLFDKTTFDAQNGFSTYNVVFYVDQFPLISDTRKIIDEANNLKAIIQKEQLSIESKSSFNFQIISSKGALCQSYINQISGVYDISSLPKGVYIVIIESMNKRNVLKFIR